MSEKTFDVGGTSIKNGVRTWRFANGKPEARAKVLEKDNHSEIKLIQLPRAMTRDEAIAHLKTLGFDAAEPTRAVPAAREAKPKQDKPGRSTLNKADRDARPSVLVELETVEDPELDERAKKVLKTSWLSFMTWDELPPETRAEFRLEARNVMEAEKAAA